MVLQRGPLDRIQCNVSIGNHAIHENHKNAWSPEVPLWTPRESESVAQLAERSARYARVGGSTPIAGDFFVLPTPWRDTLQYEIRGRYPMAPLIGRT